jgi:hypothetical protein
VLATSGIALKWTLSGSIASASAGSGATVSLGGGSSATTTADSNGNYSFTGLANGPYNVTPTKSGVSFSPSNQSVTLNGASQSAVNFTAQAVTYTISGSVAPVNISSEATVVLGGTSSTTTTADITGNYSFTGLANGSYTVTPSKSGVTFSPSNQPVTINGANQSVVNFAAQTALQSSVQLIQKTANGNEGTTASMSLAFPSSNTAGNFLIVVATIARPCGHAERIQLTGEHLRSSQRAGYRYGSKRDFLSVVRRELQGWSKHSDGNSWCAWRTGNSHL